MPGCLAPHLWLADGSSLYDHFGAGYSLLITLGDNFNAGAFNDAAKAAGVPLTVLAQLDERLPALYQARFVLIRPDQHVAWRAERLPENPKPLLCQITGHLAD